MIKLFYKFAILSRIIDNISYYNLNEDILREVIVKIELERIDIQEGIMVEALLDSRATRLVMSLKFARKQEFKLKKIERFIYIRNIDSSFNKERLIKHIVEVNIYCQKHRKKTEINVIDG